jgi:hypothetical protein
MSDATQSSTEQLYYLLSLKHSQARFNVWTFWGKDRCGYVWDLENAGQYTEAEARKASSLEPDETVAIPVEVVEALSVRRVDHNNANKTAMIEKGLKP